MPETHADQAEHADVGARHVGPEPEFAVGRQDDPDDDQQHDQDDDDYESPDVCVREELANQKSADLIGEADDPRSGHELLLKSNPHVILLDLPRDAKESLRSATQWKTEFPGVQIFAVSALKNPDLILAAMRAGASEYLSKPLEVKELKTALEKASREIERGVGRPRLNL